MSPTPISSLLFPSTRINRAKSTSFNKKHTKVCLATGLLFLLHFSPCYPVITFLVTGSGQTGKTTAHLMPWNDDYYSEIEDVHGRETSALVGDSHRSAIDWVERVVKEEGIECEFERVDGYLFPHDDKKSTLDELTEVRWLNLFCSLCFLHRALLLRTILLLGCHFYEGRNCVSMSVGETQRVRASGFSRS